mmetsp:Transcript_13437/g.31815  ORF Transcript_13437/g.31815 Transcript_13437/m.31815 type:complete len:274 (+) Transcript_13437:1079-1900(+)
MSGGSTWIWRSKRPGRSRAESRTSGRLVPAMTTMLPVSTKPSISTSSWLSVFSRSSLPPMPPPLPRERPMASISSMKMRHGALARAVAKRSRTRDGPTPTNISTKSEPETERKGTLASPAVALASSVLPVPGGPTSSAPLGILAPRLLYFSGFLRKSTTSMTSTLASARPATSLKSTPVFFSLAMIVGFDLPTENILPMAPPPPLPPMLLAAPRIMKIQKPMSSSVGASLNASELQLVSDSYVTGRYSRGETESSSCACSSLRSKPLTLPKLK